MKHPTFKEQFDKVTIDYIEGKIQPYDGRFCFCGTLNNYSGNWRWGNLFYSQNDFTKMEDALLNTINRQTVKHRSKFMDDISTISGTDKLRESVYTHPNYENALFNGMCAALEVLKQIHIEHGEVIDEVPVFQKRKLQLS